MSEIKFTTQLIGFKEQNIVVNEKIQNVMKRGVLFKRIFGKLTTRLIFAHIAITITLKQLSTTALKRPT